MNDEKLIALVRQNPVLYDFANSKYCDNNFKERIWTGISIELKTSAPTLKTRWNSLRDQFRNFHKKHVMKSGQGASTIRKWRYYEEMSFLLPFLRSRNSVKRLASEDDYKESLDTMSDDFVTKQEYEFEDFVEIEATDETATNFQEEDRRYTRKQIGRNDSASPVLMQYLLEKQGEQVQQQTARNPTDLFFETISEKVKRFNPYYRNLAETKIFALVQEMELEQIKHQYQKDQEPDEQQ